MFPSLSRIGYFRKENIVQSLKVMEISITGENGIALIYWCRMRSDKWLDDNRLKIERNCKRAQTVIDIGKYESIGVHFAARIKTVLTLCFSPIFNVVCESLAHFLYLNLCLSVCLCFYLSETNFHPFPFYLVFIIEDSLKENLKLWE